MLEVILTYINSRIQSLGHFKELKSLCELVKRDDIIAPAEYCTKDEYKEIDFDYSKGVVYHRLTDRITITEAAGENSACDVYITQTYPMRAVYCVTKEILNSDNNFIDIKIAENIARIIALKNNKALTGVLKADVVSIKIKSYDIDRERVWNEEHEGIDMAVDYKYTYGAIDYDITVEGTNNCFEINNCT
jgi:hypothetical protein